MIDPTASRRERYLAHTTGCRALTVSASPPGRRPAPSEIAAGAESPSQPFRHDLSLRPGPDISDKMRHRKRESLTEANPERAKKALLTHCPSCVQGLGRNRDLGVQPKHSAVELAEKLSGRDWVKKFRERAERGVAFTF